MADTLKLYIAISLTFLLEFVEGDLHPCGFFVLGEHLFNGVKLAAGLGYRLNFPL